MPSSVIIYGNRLFAAEWEKIRVRKPSLFKEITFLSQAELPPVGCSDGTIYLDLDKEDFQKPEFIRQLTASFDKLQIVGVADNIHDQKMISAKSLGVRELLSPGDYQGRVTALLNGENKSSAETPSIFPGFNQYDINSIIGVTARMHEIKKMLHHLADVDFPNAIIFGETGTGKDLLAKVMHYSGVRRDNHFIEVNCSAIPDELFESELFGHKKGAFTDAKSDKTGLFEFANNGTIFLDEIGNLTPSSQAKLLKILESRKLRALGAVEDKDINVRVLAATNIDLDEAVAAGGFREDLLFRLNLIAIHLPPLRERKEDIPELAAANFKYYCTIYRKPNLLFSDAAAEMLLGHDWPGNVRELRNVIERTVLLATVDKITAEHIKDALKNGRVTLKERRSIVLEIPDNGLPLCEIERRVVGEILNMVGWNKTEAARLLGISRARLRRIMEDNELHENRRTSGKSGTK